MKKKYIIILSIGIVLMISYLIIFSGTTTLPPSNIVEKYDPFFNSLIMPITKYKKGFFKHTFYTQITIDKVKYDIGFKINYLNHTITVENNDKLNERIKRIKSKITRPIVHEYSYMQINSESYFDDI